MIDSPRFPSSTNIIKASSLKEKDIFELFYGWEDQFLRLEQQIVDQMTQQIFDEYVYTGTLVIKESDIENNWSYLPVLQLKSLYEFVINRIEFYDARVDEAYRMEIFYGEQIASNISHKIGLQERIVEHVDQFASSN